MKNKFLFLLGLPITMLLFSCGPMQDEMITDNHDVTAKSAVVDTPADSNELNLNEGDSDSFFYGGYYYPYYGYGYGYYGYPYYGYGYYGYPYYGYGGYYGYGDYPYYTKTTVTIKKR